VKLWAGVEDAKPGVEAVVAKPGEARLPMIVPGWLYDVIGLVAEAENPGVLIGFIPPIVPICGIPRDGVIMPVGCPPLKAW